MHAPRILAASLVAFGLILPLACSSSDAPSRAPTTADAACSDCPQSGAFPSGPCAAGTAPLAGSSTCSSVGWSSACPVGFVAARDGWGCDAIVPSKPCTGATRASIGDEACVPLGDCGGPFPSSEATLFVDDDGPEDAAHFRTIGAAIAAATANAVIAIDAGTYTEAISLPRAVTLQGRCAEQVIVESAGDADAGITLTSGADATVSSLTLRGHRGGILVQAGSLKASSLRVEANRDLGLVVVGKRSRVRLEKSVIRDTIPLADGRIGRGVDVEVGGVAELVDSSIEGNTDIGVFVEAATVKLDGALVLRTATTSKGDGGRGINGRQGSTVEIRRSLVAHNHEIGVFVASSKVRVEDSVIRDNLPNEAGTFGRGMTIHSGSEATIRTSRISGNIDTGVDVDGGKATLEEVVIASSRETPAGAYGIGLYAKQKATAVLRRTAVVDNRGFGVLATGSDLTMEDSAILATESDVTGKFGLGLAVADGSRGRITRCSVDGARFAGVLASSPGTTLTMENTLVANTRAQAKGEPYGHGILAIYEARADLTTCAVRSAASVALLYGAASGFVSASRVEGSAVGVHTTEGTALVQASREPGEHELVISDDTLFRENATRVGSGAIALPDRNLSFD